MDRYWRELDRQRRLNAGREAEVEIRCPLGTPPAHSREAIRPVRAWQKYYHYPWLVRRMIRQAVSTVHVLDHSYAHLLAEVPRHGVYKIATVHDLAPLRDASTLTGAQLRRFRWTVEHLHEADLVLAVSAYSAREITALLGLDPAKLRVLPEGVDPELFSARPDGAARPPLPDGLAGRQVVLSVGANVPRKNLEVLPAVFRLLQGKGVTLLRIGDPLPAALAAELRVVLGSEGLVELGRAPDAALVQAYQRADALIVPSRIEGFGFPVLEAMAAGCPVVCSNVTSLPEVGGGAALYFAPDDAAAAAGHLQRLLGEPAFKESMAAAGRRQAAAFSWARHFERLLEFYRGGAAGDGTVP